jgi:ATP-dependent helicase YprA (DUF1998 family)
MQTPQDTLDSALGRAAEITWWNRAMTKLNEVDGVTNAQSFVANELIEQKGPFVEFVDAPKFHGIPATTFLGEELDYHPDITGAIVEELFGGDRSGSLYQHQAETIEAIEKTNNDNILAVPTAAGKTEAFFLPILNYCLSTDEEGLKSVVVYPMKTLGVDQLNRFITYLDHINRNRRPEDRITIGIWDSDTPQRLGSREYEVEEGAYVRGLVDPRNEDDKLRVLSNTSVGTDDNQYSWIRVTKDAIRQGVDILLTNPEALDYMFVSDNEETLDILGRSPGEQPLKHIVFDEAHVWSGIQGAAISLLTQRLKYFYSDNDPQVTMVSATVDNPKSLAASLTRNKGSKINSIGFTPREFSVRGVPDFDRFEPCDLSDIITTLSIATLDVRDPRGLVEQLELEGAVKTLDEVGLVDEEELTTTSGKPEWAVKPISDKAESLLRGREYDDATSIVKSADGRNRIIETVIETSGFTSGWYGFVLESVPEVAEFTKWFDTGTTGVVGFKSYDKLIGDVAEQSTGYPEEVMRTVMAFGRLAGIVTEKYHVFLKPPHRVHWCRECESVTRDSRCPHCESPSTLPEIKFCRNCHEPYVQIETESGEEGDARFTPIRSTGRPYDGDCPGCDGSPRLSDVGVPTSSLLSYMLTEICRVTPSKKTLVFSDSRRAAESVGDKIIDTEYGLMAQTLYLQELIDEGGRANNHDLYIDVASKLQEEYWNPLIQNEIDEDTEAYNTLQPLQKTVRGHASLSNCESLLDSALVTADVVAEISDPVKIVVAHEAYKLFALQRASFTKEGVNFNGLTRSKLVDRIDKRLNVSEGTIDSMIDEVLDNLHDAGVVSVMPHDDVKQEVDDENPPEAKRKKLREFLNSARETVDSMGIPDGQADSGIFTRKLHQHQDDSDLVILPEVGFCAECYSSHPATMGGESVGECQKCGKRLETQKRFSEDENGGLRADPGYAEIDSGWDYAVDHWAHDVTRPIQDGGTPEFISVGIHHGNIPHTVRGAIEESFKKEGSGVNIVSSTPTMELGVDIGSLDTVGQVGVPPTLTKYVQRSGRTGRTRGSSSLVMTVVRGQHPVDGHYYANLESYLGSFEPVRVPNPYDFDELLAGHVATEVFAYLARNPHPEDVLQRMYSIPEPERENLAKFVSNVREHIEILNDFICDEMDGVLRDRMREVFDDRGVEVYDQIFFGNGPLSLSRRTEQTFGGLTGMSGSAGANRQLTKQTSRLDQWLGKLGYLANYRTFGQSFPVKFSGTSDKVSFEAGGRLYDMYPGQQNGLGAMVTHHGIDYVVSDVRGTPNPITGVAICDNEECDRRFQSYDADEGVCPHCESELKITDVHGVANVECEEARGGRANWRTHAEMSTHIGTPEDSTSETDRTSLFDLECEVEYGQYELTDFVYAFERGHSRSPDTDIFRSEALIEEDEEAGTSESDMSWRDRLDEAEEEKYRPVGQQYHTQGTVLRFDKEKMEERYEKATHEPKSWPQALISIEQAMRRAVAVVAECDRSDFRVKAKTTDEHVEIFLVDSRQGGNGIAWQVHESLGSIEDRIKEIADCDRCADYCDECLLISRTPAYYLENDLLNRQTLGTIVGVNGEI